MLPHVLEATPYAGVEPPDVLAREAGIPEDQVVKLDGNENLYGPAPGVAEALAAYDAARSADFDAIHFAVDPPASAQKTR